MTNHTESQDTMDRIAQLYKQGADGDAAAVKQALSLLEKLRRSDPKDPLAAAYHGGIKILVARDESKAMSKLRWSKAGLALLDQAVKDAPNDGMVRLLRGRSSYKLPEKYFGRTKTAIEDFVFLIERLRQGQYPLLAKEKEMLQYELGDAYRRIGRYADATAAWKALLAETKDASLARNTTEQVNSITGKADEVLSNEQLEPLSVMFTVTSRLAGRALNRWADQQEEKARRNQKKKKKRKK